MKAAPTSRREQIRWMLADLKMPGALEAVDGILSKADSGSLTAAEAIQDLLGAQIGLRNNRRLQASSASWSAKRTSFCWDPRGSARHTWQSGWPSPRPRAVVASITALSLIW